MQTASCHCNQLRYVSIQLSAGQADLAEVVDKDFSERLKEGM